MNRLRAYLELARLSNLPTVWTNVLVGLYAGYIAQVVSGPTGEVGGAGWRLIGAILNQGFVLLLALSCLYVGGMVLNDLADMETDRRQRPERPLPSGRVSPTAARVLAAALFGLGLVGLGVYARPDVMLWGVLLIVAIVVYNLFHKRSPIMVVFMGATRALVYLTAAAAFPAPGGTWWWFVAPFAAVLLLYTVLVTVIARAESGGRVGDATWLAPGMVVLVLLPGLFIHPAAGWIWVILAAGAVVFWLARAALLSLAQPPRVPQAVMTWLSGICLIDAFFLTLLARPTPALLAGGCWLVTAAAHRRVSGT